MKEFDRFKLLIGKNNFCKISNTCVLVLGLGGVGSYVVESLIRSGIKKIILVDYDSIDITNLNRQIMTSQDNIGYFKTEVLKNRIKSINPYCEVVTINSKITDKNIELLFKEPVDFLADCCDYLPAKKALIKQASMRNIKLISCMGVGNKMHPTRLNICDLKKTTYDPIARILRKYMRDEKINYKVMVVCSDEPPINASSIGSNSFVPASAGLLMTSYIINNIVGDLNGIDQ